MVDLPVRPTIAVETNDEAKCAHICAVTVILNCIFYKDPRNNPVMQERFNISARRHAPQCKWFSSTYITLSNAPPSHAHTMLRALQPTSSPTRTSSWFPLTTSFRVVRFVCHIQTAMSNNARMPVKVNIPSNSFSMH